ncbi:deoxyribose-phosphate aldolase-like [Watersipora subatra]|uniref:deoxyribose-phosphate aldolase-like n=1 Tax=Watersipora subatra TaxID=2589382 RepID=UPI00355B066A
MSERNQGVEWDESWIKDVKINLPAVKARAATLGTRRTVKKKWQAAWLLKAAACIDLTTLAGDDTSVNVQRLCYKAKNPIREDLVTALGVKHLQITCGAVCVYPSRVSEVVKSLKECGGLHIPIASVATGFPAGQTPLHTRLEEIRYAVKEGATEIDIVINRPYVLSGNWKAVYDEVRQMREACGEAHMKTILATGECGTMTNVYKASMVCMMAGADFIKTSTGKEGVNAILPVGLVMVRAIREYYERTWVKVGFKPAGGIRTAKDACVWLSLMKEELGDAWLNPHFFRLGASSLLVDVERQLYHHVYGRYAATHEFPMS